MTTIVRVQLSKLDLQDDATLSALADFDNASFGRRDGIPMMTVYVGDDQPLADVVIEATRKLSNKVPGTRALRVHPDLVAISKIAHRVGVSREAVRKWTLSKRLPFPACVSKVNEDTPVWEWIDVTDWLFEAKGIDLRRDQPTRAEVDHVNSCIARVPDHTTGAWTRVATSSVQTPQELPVNRLVPTAQVSFEVDLPGSPHFQMRPQLVREPALS